MTENKRLCLVSLGCPKNLVDSEHMLALLADAGYELTEDMSEADAAVINTCAFIESACSESIEAILSAAEYKKTGKLRRLVVAGCLPQRYKDGLADEMPEIDAVVGTGDIERIADALRPDGGRDFIGGNAALYEGDRLVTTGPSWAYIRIAEGCSNRCAYCVIPDIRGPYRSRTMESIIDEARTLADSGVKELIVVAQDTTMYGMDLYGERKLAELVRELCKIDGLRWIRLHYLYPDGVTDELMDVIANEPKVLKYLDIPIQHINNAILDKMGRRGTGDEIRELFRRLRERIPGLVLRTSIITGLPGEGEAEFEELCEFLREARIERAGVFPYSPEDGTPAAEMDRPDTDTALHRAELIDELQAGIMEDFNASRVGKETTVLCCGYSEEKLLYFGRSFAESPDVDGSVWLAGEDLAPGEFYKAVIRGELDGEAVGEVTGRSLE